MKIKELKLLDYITIFAAIAVIAVGVLVFLGKNKFSKSPVEATKKIAFQVMLKSVSLTDSKPPFEIGEESFITIRNVPYTKLQIIDVIYQPKKTVVPTGYPPQPFIVVDDYSQPSQYDFVVSLIDDAKITKDGPVAGGNKIKIGMPIVLEGFNYRIGGTVSNVQVLEDENVEQINKYVEAQKLQRDIKKVQNSTSVPSKNQKSTTEQKTDKKPAEKK